ncbi:MAG: hypothetical protein ACRDGI_07765 [Candidatus Limnocylindrales bacterium]
MRVQRGDPAEGRAAAIALSTGVALIIATQLLAPVAAPLFDALLVLGPYHYLAPAAGELGDPTSATITDPVANGASPGFNAATTETPPQAQLIASPDSIQLAPGSTTVTVTIEPVAPPAPSSVGEILTNVYRYSVTDQNGAVLEAKRGTLVTLVMRVPHATSDAVMAQFSDNSWNVIASSPSGTPGFFLATTGTFGDFALVAAPNNFAPLEISLLVLVVGGVLGAIGFLVLRRQRRLAMARMARTGRPRGRRAGQGRDRGQKRQRR